jgi:hypothetical protein
MRHEDKCVCMACENARRMCEEIAEHAANLHEAAVKVIADYVKKSFAHANKIISLTFSEENYRLIGEDVLAALAANDPPIVVAWGRTQPAGEEETSK